MSALEEAKARLPLPELMTQLGLGEHAERSAKCPFHEDRNNSFSVFQCDGEWFWKCHAGCGTGDAPDLLAKIEGISNSDACRKFIGMACGADRGPKPATIARKVAASPSTPKPLPPVPDSVRKAWKEGVDYLFNNPTTAARLAGFRGWPVAFAQYLIECGAISFPLHGKERGYAFQVVAPEGQRGSMTTRPVGYHIRLSKEKGWRFLPNDSEHGQGIPALPYTLGEFEKARLLIITEGGWDALTFALAAGWLGDGCMWPVGVGLIGMRGVSSVGAFLKHYRPFWPAAVNCLVLADADEIGSVWYKGDHSFAQQLAELGANVSVVDCGTRKDFNDLFRAEKPGPEEIHELLATHSMSIESGVTA